MTVIGLRLMAHSESYWYCAFSLEYIKLDDNRRFVKVFAIYTANSKIFASLLFRELLNSRVCVHVLYKVYSDSL